MYMLQQKTRIVLHKHSLHKPEKQQHKGMKIWGFLLLKEY